MTFLLKHLKTKHLCKNMHYHLVLTTKCNSKCRYCYGKSMKEENDLCEKFCFDFSSDSREIDVDKLKKFIEKDKEAVIEFYGGEPLLKINKIKEIINKIDVPFRMQTNGKLLDKIPIEYLKKIGKILVSIDGNKEKTDCNRGKGSYDKVISNIKKIRKDGYKGEIAARMCISGFSDIYEQVKHLIDLGLFDSIHWQLDAGFYKCDYDFDKFSKFVDEYNKEITKLIDYWVDEMKKGKVLMLYPFVGIMDSLLKGEKSGLRCGAGYAGYAIGCDGKIYACPITTSIKDFEAGTLENNPKELKKFGFCNRCLKCKIKDLCGGRCLYWNKTNLWPKEGNELICKTIRHLISELRLRFDEIKKLIDRGEIKQSDFNYEKFFGPEIIP